MADPNLGLCPPRFFAEKSYPPARERVMSGGAAITKTRRLDDVNHSQGKIFRRKILAPSAGLTPMKGGLYV